MRAARNEKELRNVLLRNITKGLNNSLDKFSDKLEQSFALNDIPSPNATMYEELGVPYQPRGGITDVENVWEPRVEERGDPTLILEYNQDNLSIGEPYPYRHNSPIGTHLGNFADLITQGRGGKLFGEDNPTRTPRDFWSTYENIVDNNWESWIKAGFRQAGL